MQHSQKTGWQSINMFKYCKLSQYKIKKILYCFSQDLTAIQTANFLNLHRNTINRYYRLFREKILIASEAIRIVSERTTNYL